MFGESAGTSTDNSSLNVLVYPAFNVCAIADLDPWLHGNVHLRRAASVDRDEVGQGRVEATSRSEVVVIV
jgi:hypothetical protein